ncbi:hypothetical protein [Enemella evansiae]|uniref:hypothetical protein n=1 Tax=Enemella evansiae TaxID=2016499 RepID=UPI001E4B0CA0|nr:hypothetical protein [Enemella evansiae]
MLMLFQRLADIDGVATTLDRGADHQAAHWPFGVGELIHRVAEDLLGGLACGRAAHRLDVDRGVALHVVLDRLGEQGALVGERGIEARR